MSSNIYINPSEQYYKGIFSDSNALSITTGDKRYIRIGSDAALRSLTLSGSMFMGGSISTNTILCTNITSTGTVAITGSLTLNGQSIVGGSYLPLTGGSLSGALSVSGNVNITGNYLKNGVAISTPPALTPVSTDPSGIGTNTSGIVWYSNSSRYFGMRAIDTNTFSLLSYSAGGAYSDYLVWTHNTGTPILSLTDNCLFAAPEIVAINTMSTKSFNLQDTIASGGSFKTMMTIGSNTDNLAKWNVQTLLASSNANSQLNIANDFSGLGLNIGSGSSFSASKGAIMVINGINNNGGIITCGTSQALGTLHINGGTSTSVPSGWRYSPTGSSSYGGGTVNISLYCWWGIHVASTIYCTSDRRLKTNIQTIDSNKAMNLLKIQPVWYNWTKDAKAKKELGVIAQDLLTHDLAELTCCFENKDVTSPDDEFELPAETQLGVMYDRIPMYLIEINKQLLKRIEDLEEGIRKLNRRLR